MRRKLIAVMAVSVMTLSCLTTGCDKTTSKTGEKVVYEEVPSPEMYAEISSSVEYTTYYFDSELGNDENDGLSEEMPKQTVKAANSIIENCKEDVPTKVLFKAGSEYAEALKVVSFEAKEESPLIIDVYGATEGKEYASFSAEPNCVEICGSNVRISGLELSNPNAYRGFYVYTKKAGASSNIVLKGNYIHDINFLWGDLSEGNRPEDVAYETVSAVDICPVDRYIYQYSGIYFTASTDRFPGASWYENVWLEGNTIKRVSRAGIFINSDWVRRPGLDWGNNRYYDDETGWYPHKNFNVLNNDISYTGGDAIVLIGTDGGFIQGNTSYHAQYLGRAGYYTAGIWAHSSKNLVFQYNEAAYTHLPTGAGDGQGFDIDIGNTNILFQYNYSHHNEGGGLLLCNHPSLEILYNKDGTFVQDEDALPVREMRHSDWKDVVIRNNVFADNGDTVFHIQGKVENLMIANNTIVVPGETGEQGIVKSNAWGDNTILGKNWSFINNIFYLRNQRSSRFELEFCPDATIENNVFYNFEDSFLTEKVKNAVDCETFNPGLMEMEARPGIENMKDFVPSNEKCLTAGQLLNKMSATDYAGNSTADKKYVGAFNTTN